MKVKGKALAAMALVVAACGGGGGGNNPEQPSMSGKVDATYGSAGRVTFDASESMVEAAVDSGGNAYVTGANLVKLDRSGNRIAGYGGPVSPSERAPVPDPAGNLYTAWNRGVVKRGPTGQIDPSFGTDGKVEIVPPTIDTQKVSMLHRYADGSLRAITLDPTVNFAMHRPETFTWWTKLDPAGQTLEGYGPTGGGTGAAGFSYTDPGVSTALDPQANLAIAGRTFNSGYAVVKLNPGGGRVSGFADNGYWSAPFCGTAQPSDTAVALTAAGDVYLGVSCEGAATVFKVDAQGNLVGGFGSAGRAAGFFPNGGSIGALLATADGSLYIAGAVPAPACKQLAIAKLAPNGTPDASFGTNGMAALATPADDSAKELALDASGMLYLAARSPEQCPVTDAPAPYVIYRLFR